MKRTRRVLALAVVLMGARGAAAATKAWLDNNHSAPGESVQLTVEHDGPPGEQPDLTGLKQSFDVLDSQSAASLEIVAGRTLEHTRVALTLAPRRSGEIQVPAIAWGRERSAPLMLVVSDVGPGGVHAARKVFLETDVAPSKPYVQSAVEIAVRVYSTRALYRAELDLASTPSVNVRQIGNDEHGSARRDGKNYDVLTRHYLAFPQQSGTISLAGPVLNAQVLADQDRPGPYARLFGPAQFAVLSAAAKPVRLRGEPLQLEVQPRPAGTVGSYWLPARTVTLSAEWTPDTLRAQMGDPVTAHLKLQALGLPAEQLPDLAGLWTLPAGLKAYPDEAKLDGSMQGDSVLGTREQTIAFVASQPGQFVLPPLTIKWWDTNAQQLREVTLPGRTLSMVATRGAVIATRSEPAAAAGIRERRAPATMPAADGRWRALAFGLGALWLATLALWAYSSGLFARRRGSADGSAPESASRATAEARAFRRACQSDDAPAARRHLLAWAALEWPEPAPRGLSALAQASADRALGPLLRELDRACYGGGVWQGAALATALPRLPRAPRSVRVRASALEPLYP